MTAQSKFIAMSVRNVFRRLCSGAAPEPTSLCNVALIGADSKVGELSSLLLKMNPLISSLHLQGGKAVHGLAVDLHDIDTRCPAHSHPGFENLKYALKTANIVVLLGGAVDENASVGDRIMQEGTRLCEVATQCVEYAKRAFVVVGVKPISVMTPLMVDMYRGVDWYHPGRIVGFLGATPGMLNNAVSQLHLVDPKEVVVPITGGPDMESIVPLLSVAKPCPVDESTAFSMLQEFKCTFDPKRSVDEFVSHPFAEAVALNRLVSTIARGIHGDETAVDYAYVRTTLSPGCQFMVCKVRFGKLSIEHNYGLPKKMNLFERECVVCSNALRQHREKMARAFYDYFVSESVQKTKPPLDEMEIDRRDREQYSCGIREKRCK